MNLKTAAVMADLDYMLRALPPEAFPERRRHIAAVIQRCVTGDGAAPDTTVPHFAFSGKKKAAPRPY
jgi:hypothetical protein